MKEQMKGDQNANLNPTILIKPVRTNVPGEGLQGGTWAQLESATRNGLKQAVALSCQDSNFCSKSAESAEWEGDSLKFHPFLNLHLFRSPADHAPRGPCQASATVHPGPSAEATGIVQ